MNIKDTRKMTPFEILGYIDEWYLHAKVNKWSRMSVEWGKWSRSMNVETRKRSKNDPFRVALAYVFNYWIVRSRMLENYFKGTIIGKWKNKKMTKEICQLRELINEEMENPTPPSKIPSFDEYIKELILK